MQLEERVSTLDKTHKWCMASESDKHAPSTTIKSASTGGETGTVAMMDGGDGPLLVMVAHQRLLVIQRLLLIM